MRFKKTIIALFAICTVLSTCTGCKDKYDDYIEENPTETRVTTTTVTTETTEPIEEKAPEVDVEDQESKKIEIDSTIAKKEDDGRIILNTENESVEITTTKHGDTIAIITTTNDKNEEEVVKVAVIVDEDTGETVIDPTKTVITIDDEDIVEDIENLIIIIDDVDDSTPNPDNSNTDPTNESNNSEDSKQVTPKDPTTIYINIGGPDVSNDLVSVLSDVIAGRTPSTEVPESIKGIIDIIKGSKDNSSINVTNKSDGSKIITVTVTTNIVKTEGTNVYVEQVDTIIRITQPPVKYVPTELVIVDDDTSDDNSIIDNTPKVTEGPKVDDNMHDETTTTTVAESQKSKESTSSSHDDGPNQEVDPNNEISIPVVTKPAEVVTTPAVTSAPKQQVSSTTTTTTTTVAQKHETVETTVVETQAPTENNEPNQPNIIHIDACAHYRTERKYKTFKVKAIDPNKLKEYIDEDCNVPIRYGEWTFRVYEGLYCNECGEWLEKYSVEFDDSDDIEYWIYNVADTSNITLDEAILRFVTIKKEI